MRKFLILFVIATILPITNIYADHAEFKEGDIIFQMSKSKQSPFIQLATHSIWSHCGVVIEKNGNYYVLEASNTVKLTPIDDWINRGRGRFCWTRRVINKPIHINYKKYLGQPYDLSFKFNNGKMYCSELVYVIYRDQLGIKLCNPRKVSSYTTFGLSKMMKRRGINPDQLVVAPCDLL